VPSFTISKKELALIYIELANLEIPKFRGQKDEFTTWLFKVEPVFGCYNRADYEKFTVVIS